MAMTMNRRIIIPPSGKIRVSLGRLHAGQAKAHQALLPYRFKVLRAGRRFGKTQYAENWICDGLLRGLTCAWFAPQHRTWSEIDTDLRDKLAPIIKGRSKTAGTLHTIMGGRLDYWTLENAIAGRGRFYHRIVIDEAAFAKNGDNTIEGSLMSIWQKAIAPTLFDYGGEVLICSNSAGKNPDNFFYNICTDPQYGFGQVAATTRDNPTLPKLLPNESHGDWQQRREYELEQLERNNDPRVFAQEYLAKFVDWSGAAFFARDKLLDDGRPVPFPKSCECVFAVIDTASKTGTEHDATAVTFFALNRYGGSFPLLVLDWDITQIEGAFLEVWLPSVFKRLEELARLCGARKGSIGAMIEDQNSGTILLQQALRRKMLVRAIESKLTSKGKDERALSVSGYVFRGEVKYTEHAFHKTAIYKQKSKNHLLDQVEGFRMGAKDDKREDDLLDTFCYGIALSLGNNDGF
jgi:hypothetical protein